MGPHYGPLIKTHNEYLKNIYLKNILKYIYIRPTLRAFNIF